MRFWYSKNVHLEGLGASTLCLGQSTTHDLAVILREVSLRKVSRKRRRRMHAAASSSSSSIIGLLSAYKQSEKSQLHLWKICSGGGGEEEVVCAYHNLRAF